MKRIDVKLLKQELVTIRDCSIDATNISQLTYRLQYNISAIVIFLDLQSQEGDSRQRC